jgi:hypothetical protein
VTSSAPTADMTDAEKQQYYLEQIAFCKEILRYCTNDHWQRTASRNIAIYKIKLSKLVVV